MKKKRFLEFPNCGYLHNSEIEIVVSLDFGPRILSYSFIGGENVLGIHSDARIETVLGDFRPYGGHRFWIAPENMPNSYAPDNSPIEYFFDEEKNSLHLVQPTESISQTKKEMTITLDESGSGVSILHKITNLGEQQIELAAWALTIMRGGGEVFVPNEPFAAYSAETLLPVRSFAVWSYTNLSDPRWQFTNEFLRLKVDESKSGAQKIGVLNKKGWIKYELHDVEFIKTFDYKKDGIYPDMNSNTELYVAGNFIEIETLAPLCKLGKDESTEHVENWKLVNLKN